MGDVPECIESESDRAPAEKRSQSAGEAVLQERDLSSCTHGAKVAAMSASGDGGVGVSLTMAR
jgi:hypothetical protein